MKTYGILDGLLVGLAAGLLVIAGVVAAHDYAWLAWAIVAAALFVVAAMMLAAKRGHGMVDGVILRPWLRQLLLAVLVAELAGTSIAFFVERPGVPPVVPTPPPPPTPTLKLVADACSRLAMDADALAKVVEHKEGTARDALGRHAELRVKASTCDDAFKSRLAAIQDKLAAWNAESKEERIDDQMLTAQLDALAQPVIEAPPPRPDAQPDRTHFVPDFAFVPRALLPSPPPDAPATVTVEENRRSILDAILRLLPAGISFGNTKITTTTILGRTMQSADDHGRVVLQAMADSIPPDRPDRLAEFWLQLRMLANDPATPADQRQAISAFLDGQGSVPILCDWVLLSLKERIGEEVAAKIKVDENRVNDVLKSLRSDQWPSVYADVEACVFARDRNHFAAYHAALKGLDSTRGVLRSE